MAAISAIRLLEAWERAAGQNPVQRTLAILGTAYPDRSIKELGLLSIGERDTLLLQLREHVFGKELPAIASCPACQQMVEFELTTTQLNPPARGERQAGGFDLKQDAIAKAEVPHEPPHKAELELNSNGRTLRFRLPNSFDLAALENDDVGDCRQRVFARCVEGFSSSEIQPEELIEAVASEMARADPVADIRVSLDCASCGHGWQESFDIASFFWRELNAWAQRTLRDVHQLAAAYGWCESDILSLSHRRRNAYIELLGQ